MNLDWIKSGGNALIYIGDTMCSWCHGYQAAEQIETIIQKVKAEAVA